MRLKMNNFEKIASDLIEEREKVVYNNDENIFFGFIAISFAIVFTLLGGLTFIDKNNINIYFSLLLLSAILIPIFAVILIFHIERVLKQIKKISLKKDKEYQLAKKIMKKYQEKIRKQEIKEKLNEELEKSKRISEMQKYLNS